VLDQEKGYDISRTATYGGRSIQTKAPSRVRASAGLSNRISRGREVDFTTCPRSFSSAVLLAFSLAVFGCDEAQNDAAGATYCQSSADGSAVACGRKATYCQSSADGSAVACGRKATYCESSSDGSAVACGGMATYCESSSDGSAVACGGMAKR
jgi:hypothetical protein